VSSKDGRATTGAEEDNGHRAECANGHRRALIDFSASERRADSAALGRQAPSESVLWRQIHVRKKQKKPDQNRSVRFNPFQFPGAMTFRVNRRQKCPRYHHHQEKNKPQACGNKARRGERLGEEGRPQRAMKKDESVGPSRAHGSGAPAASPRRPQSHPREPTFTRLVRIKKRSPR